MKIAAVVALVSVSFLACSSTSSGSACVDEPVATVKSKLGTGKCTGSPRSCSSISIYSTEGRKQCAYMQGCTPDYDSTSCTGTPKSCAEQSERWCKDHQLGCTWVEGDEAASTVGSSGGGAAGVAPGGSPPSGSLAGGTTVSPCKTQGASAPEPTQPGQPGSSGSPSGTPTAAPSSSAGGSGGPAGGSSSSGSSGSSSSGSSGAPSEPDAGSSPPPPPPGSPPPPSQ